MKTDVKKKDQPPIQINEELSSSDSIVDETVETNGTYLSSIKIPDFAEVVGDLGLNFCLSKRHSTVETDNWECFQSQGYNLIPIDKMFATDTPPALSGNLPA